MNNSTLLKHVGIALISSLGSVIAGRIAGEIAVKTDNCFKGLFDNLDFENMSAEEISKELDNVNKEIDKRKNESKIRISGAMFVASNMTGMILSTGLHLLADNKTSGGYSNNNNFTMGNNYMI